MPPFLAMEVLERASQLERQGRHIIHMEIGEPDFDTPQVVVEAGIRALREGRTHYTHSLGHPALREAIAEWHLRQYGTKVSPEQTIVTMGSSAAMLLVFAALLNPGDGVLLTDPHYACYPNFVAGFGGTPLRLQVHEASGFQFEAEQIRAALAPNVKAVMLNSPANPTGTLMEPERMRALVETVGDRSVIISDEIYHGLVYRGRAHSMLEFTDNAVVINGFSKLFAMTGWRLGYAIVPPWLVRPVQKLQQNLFISAPDFAQFAAIAALREAGPDVERMRTAYDERRKLVLRRLEEAGLAVLTEPLGAFYVFVNVAHLTHNVRTLAGEILEEAGVAVTPGIDFGPGGEGYLRLSYANSLENVDEGMRRLVGFLQQRRSGILSRA